MRLYTLKVLLFFLFVVFIIDAAGKALGKEVKGSNNKNKRYYASHTLQPQNKRQKFTMRKPVKQTLNNVNQKPRNRNIKTTRTQGFKKQTKRIIFKTYRTTFLPKISTKKFWFFRRNHNRKFTKRRIICLLTMRQAYTKTQRTKRAQNIKNTVFKKENIKQLHKYKTEKQSTKPIKVNTMTSNPVLEKNTKLTTKMRTFTPKPATGKTLHSDNLRVKSKQNNSLNNEETQKTAKKLLTTKKLQTKTDTQTESPVKINAITKTKKLKEQTEPYIEQNLYKTTNTPLETNHKKHHHHKHHKKHHKNVTVERVNPDVNIVDKNGINNDNSNDVITERFTDKTIVKEDIKTDVSNKEDKVDLNVNEKIPDEKLLKETKKPKVSAISDYDVPDVVDIENEIAEPQNVTGNHHKKSHHGKHHKHHHTHHHKHKHKHKNEDNSLLEVNAGINGQAEQILKENLITDAPDDQETFAETTDSSALKNKAYTTETPSNSATLKPKSKQTTAPKTKTETSKTKPSSTTQSKQQFLTTETTYCDSPDNSKPQKKSEESNEFTLKKLSKHIMDGIYDNTLGRLLKSKSKKKDKKSSKEKNKGGCKMCNVHNHRCNFAHRNHGFMPGVTSSPYNYDDNTNEPPVTAKNQVSTVKNEEDVGYKSDIDKGKDIVVTSPQTPVTTDFAAPRITSTAQVLGKSVPTTTFTNTAKETLQMNLFTKSYGNQGTQYVNQSMESTTVKNILMATFTNRKTMTRENILPEQSTIYPVDEEETTDMMNDENKTRIDDKIISDINKDEPQIQSPLNLSADTPKTTVAPRNLVKTTQAVELTKQDLEAQSERTDQVIDYYTENEIVNTTSDPSMADLNHVSTTENLVDNDKRVVNNTQSYATYSETYTTESFVRSSGNHLDNMTAHTDDYTQTEDRQMNGNTTDSLFDNYKSTDSNLNRYMNDAGGPETETSAMPEKSKNVETTTEPIYQATTEAVTEQQSTTNVANTLTTTADSYDDLFQPTTTTSYNNYGARTTSFYNSFLSPTTTNAYNAYRRHHHRRHRHHHHRTTTGYNPYGMNYLSQTTTSGYFARTSPYGLYNRWKSTTEETTTEGSSTTQSPIETTQESPVDSTTDKPDVESSTSFTFTGVNDVEKNSSEKYGENKLKSKEDASFNYKKPLESHESAEDSNDDKDKKPKHHLKGVEIKPATRYLGGVVVRWNHHKGYVELPEDEPPKKYTPRKYRSMPGTGNRGTSETTTSRRVMIPWYTGCVCREKKH